MLTLITDRVFKDGYNLFYTVEGGVLDQRLAQALQAQGDMIRTTHRKLADEVGTVREVVSRILKDFESRGYIQRSRGRLRSRIENL